MMILERFSRFELCRGGCGRSLFHDATHIDSGYCYKCHYRIEKEISDINWYAELERRTACKARGIPAFIGPGDPRGPYGGRIIPI